MERVSDSLHSSSVHSEPGKKATVPAYKILVRHERESNSRPINTEQNYQYHGPTGWCAYWAALKLRRAP